MNNKPLALTILKSSLCYLSKNVRLLKYFWVIVLMHVVYSQMKPGSLPLYQLSYGISVLAMSLISLSCSICLIREINLDEKISWKKIIGTIIKGYYWKYIGILLLSILVLVASIIALSLLLSVFALLIPSNVQGVNLLLPDFLSMMMVSVSVGVVAGVLFWVYWNSFVPLALAATSCNDPNVIKTILSLIKENGIRFYGGITLILILSTTCTSLVNTFVPLKLHVLTTLSINSALYDIFSIACKLASVFIGITHVIYAAKYYKALSAKK